jgi:hypothetical protein
MQNEDKEGKNKTKNLAAARAQREVRGATCD